MLDILYGIATDPGQRARNEDATAIFVPRSRREAQARGWMFALADGAGGHSSGEVAASKAVKVMAKGFEDAEEQTSLTSLLPRLIQHANAAVYDEALNPQWRHKGMASTIVSCAIREDQAVVSHVGDSRCYLIRDGRAESLTRDHIWVEEQRRQGLISEAEAESSESRHILTRALGIERFVAAESTTIPVRAKDALILCSDGLYEKLGSDRLARVSSGRSDDPALVAQELVSEAIRLDGSDNATALVIYIRSVEATAMYRGRQYVRPAS
ncbi:MAG: PP2C family protein-serine/threonine phosphatase [Acidobacteriaceae bacterium]